MNRKTLLITCLIGALIWFAGISIAKSQTITESYVTLKNDVKIGYGLFEPATSTKRALIQLHGQGEFPKGVDYSHATLKVHGAYKYAYERKLDWFPFYVLAIQGQKNGHQHNATQLNEAYELIKLKHGLPISEVHLTGISQGGQGIGDLVKLNPDKYRIFSTFSGVSTLNWDNPVYFNKTIGLYVWHNKDDGVVWYKYNEEWADRVKKYGGSTKTIFNQYGGHSGWNVQYGKTNKSDTSSIYNWHLSQSKVKEPVVTIPNPDQVVKIPSGKLQLKREMFSATNGVNIDAIVSAIINGQEPNINWQNKTPFDITIDLGTEAVVSKLRVKDGQGVTTDPSVLKYDAGQIGLFYGKQYNIWYDMPTYDFKTRYIRIENVQEVKKNIPIGLEITIK